MTPTGTLDVSAWPGLRVLDSSGHDLGTCSETYADAQTGEAEWLLVARSDGSFRMVPVTGARRSGDTVVVAYSSEAVVASPAFGAVAVLTPADEDRLYGHYSLPAQATAPVVERIVGAARPAVPEPVRENPSGAALAAAVLITVAAFVLLRRGRRRNAWRTSRLRPYSRRTCVG